MIVWVPELAQAFCDRAAARSGTTRLSRMMAGPFTTMVR